MCQFSNGAHVRVIDPTHAQFNHTGYIVMSSSGGPSFGCKYAIVDDVGGGYIIALDAQLALEP